MPLPSCSGRKAVRAFERDGWQMVRHRGSHMVMTKPGARATLSVPDDPEISPGTLRALIRSADLTVAAFNDLLGG